MKASAFRQQQQQQQPPPPQPQLPPLELVDWASLEGLEPPPRTWVIEGLVPASGQVSGLWGVGGIGKSTLIQQLATTTALGMPFLGMPTNGRPVLYVTTEEDHDEVWRRQYDIVRYLKITLSDLAGRLHIAPRRGLENAVGTVDTMTDQVQLTDLADQLVDEALSREATFLILDNLTQCFAAEDHKKHIVAAFVNQMAGMAMKIDDEGAVFLVGHVSRTAGSEFGGSQAWNDCVRARMFMTRTEESDVIALKLAKANYAGQQTIGLKYMEGVLRPTTAAHMSGDDRLAHGVRGETVRQLFLAALDHLTSVGVNVSPYPARNYAPKVMREFAAHQLGDAADAEVKEAMRTLMRDGRIENGPFGSYGNRHAKTGLRRTPGA